MTAVPTHSEPFDKRRPTFMIVPSLACQAACKYCFGPHRGAVMDARTAVETVRFIRDITAETAAEEVSIIFHGGEPLLAPFAVWHTMLDEIRTQLAAYKLSLSLQSNLWNLDDDFIRLFTAHKVSIGTSLDGPRDVCDTNRGKGYFDRTYPSVRRAKAAGCQVSAIATVTPQTLPHVRDTVRYFRNEGMHMVLHGAVAGIDRRDSPFALTAGEYASVIKDLFPWYVKNRKHTRIDTLDYFVKGAVHGQPGVCTFRDCFGMFLSIAPDGDVTSCQRLSGRKAFSLGNIFDRPTLAALYASKAAQAQRSREKQVAERCASCDIHPLCHGGCYYNAIASGDGVVDPFCEAYKAIYGFVHERLMDEMQTRTNMEAIASRPAGRDEHPLLRRGDYISLASRVHPFSIAANARRILSLYELSRTNDPQAAARNLYDRKICGDPVLTGKMLADMQADLRRPHTNRNNCYLHVTFACNLRCTHCYAEGGERREEMDITQLAGLMSEAIDECFRQIVITGGEPLVHTHRDLLIAACRTHRGKGSNLVLRTNLTGDFSDGDFKNLAEAFDQIVVSVDGSEQTHDLRRGKGTYRNMRRNLDEYVRIAAGVPSAAELSLACVMSAADINGAAGQSVRELADVLQVKRVRFRPLLPLGRASRLDEPVMCEGLMQHVSPDEMLQSDFRPLTTCGIGQNLFVRPDGRSYPCYAWCGEHTYIGNVFDESLHGVLRSQQFTRLASCTVDTISKCRDCAYRYLCGGACRAWGNRNELDPNAAPAQCDHLQQRAQALVDAAMEYLNG